MVTSLYMVRHGSTEAARTERFCGRTDIPLSDTGLSQAEQLADLLSAYHLARVISSPLRRTVQTAQKIAATSGIEMVNDSKLREIDFGDWEGKTFDEISTEAPDEVGEWASAPDDFCFPGGEAVATFQRRVRDALHNHCREADKNVLIVTHGGVIREGLCFFLGLPSRSRLAFSIRPASLVTVELYSGGGVLSGLNNNIYENGRSTLFSRGASD